jgi:hypothetical protein
LLHSLQNIDECDPDLCAFAIYIIFLLLLTFYLWRSLREGQKFVIFHSSVLFFRFFTLDSFFHEVLENIFVEIIQLT